MFISQKKRLISCGNKINSKSFRRWILYYEMLFVLFEQSESITEMHLRPGVQNIKNILLPVQIMLYKTVFVSVHCPITFFSFNFNVNLGMPMHGKELKKYRLEIPCNKIIQIHSLTHHSWYHYIEGHWIYLYCIA